MKRSGYICDKCGIRTDSEYPHDWLFITNHNSAYSWPTFTRLSIERHYCPECRKPFIELTNDRPEAIQ